MNLEPVVTCRENLKKFIFPLDESSTRSYSKNMNSMNSKNNDILWNTLQDLIDAGGQGRVSALKEMRLHCESISRTTGIQVSEVSEWVANMMPTETPS